MEEKFIIVKEVFAKKRQAENIEIVRPRRAC